MRHFTSHNFATNFLPNKQILLQINLIFYQFYYWIRLSNLYHNMELPHLGTNCALKACNRLDFLPVKCDACSKTFCIEHYKYDTHNCQLAKSKDVQVPICPLCSEPVVGKRGELPDVAVSQHIDQYCKANETIKRKTKQTNLQACTVKSCKQKDLIYLECLDCRSKFCIKHRHPSDHSCPGPSLIPNNLSDNWNSFKGSCSTSASSGYNIIMQKAQQIGKSGQAALNRLAKKNLSANQSTRNNNGLVGSLQGNVSEQEALAIALSQSASSANVQQRPPAGSSELPSQEDEDLALARAIHESQMNSNSGTGATAAQSNKDTCMVS